MLLVFGCWAALLTLNAARPNQRFGLLAIPSFFASWLTTELALHNFVLQVGLVLTLCWLGALEALPGWVGLGFYIASWTIMFRLVALSRRTRAAYEAAFDHTFGDANWFPESLRAQRPRFPLLAPLWLRDQAVERISNIAYTSTGHPRHRLDIYRRRAGTNGAPVILQIHGGGWVVGDKRQQGLPLMLHLANLGYVCVAANYRLSPGATFPEHLIDIKQALHWCRQHIADFGGDPNCLVLTGGSAGGHLATLAALTANDQIYQPGFESADTTVHACIPFYGVYDFTNRLGTYPAFGLGWLLEQFVMKQPYLENPAVFAAASPINRIHTGAPPFMIVHGDRDSLAPVADARFFVQSLRAASTNPVVYAELPGAQHAFDVFHSFRTTDSIRAVECFLRQVAPVPDAESVRVTPEKSGR